MKITKANVKRHIKAGDYLYDGYEYLILEIREDGILMREESRNGQFYTDKFRTYKQLREGNFSFLVVKDEQKDLREN